MICALLMSTGALLSVDSLYVDFRLDSRQEPSASFQGDHTEARLLLLLPVNPTHPAVLV